MKSSFEQALIEVWRQALVENARVVELGMASYPVRRTPKRGLRQVDFVVDGNDIRGLEQNPETKSRWAQLARSGLKVMQLLSEGRSVANVVDGKRIETAKTDPPLLVRKYCRLFFASQRTSGYASTTAKKGPPPPVLPPRTWDRR